MVLGGEVDVCQMIRKIGNVACFMRHFNGDLTYAVYRLWHAPPSARWLLFSYILRKLLDFYLIEPTLKMFVGSNEKYHTPIKKHRHAPNYYPVDGPLSHLISPSKFTIVHVWMLVLNLAYFSFWISLVLRYGFCFHHKIRMNFTFYPVFVYLRYILPYLVKTPSRWPLSETFDLFLSCEFIGQGTKSWLLLEIIRTSVKIVSIVKRRLDLIDDARVDIYIFYGATLT
jgi:hypothetical protein